MRRRSRAFSEDAMKASFISAGIRAFIGTESSGTHYIRRGHANAAFGVARRRRKDIRPRNEHHDDFQTAYAE